MRRKYILSSLAFASLVVVVLIMLVWSASQRGRWRALFAREMKTDQAFQVIDDPKATQAELEEALRCVDIWVDTPTYWMKIARDEKRTPLLRRMCVKHAFDRYVSGGVTLEHMCRTLELPANWVSYDKIYELSELGLNWTGWWPRAAEFVIPVLAEEPGEYRLVLMINFAPRRMDKDELMAVLRGDLNGSKAKIAISGCRAFDTVDSKRRGGGWGWESYSSTNGGGDK